MTFPLKNPLLRKLKRIGIDFHLKGKGFYTYFFQNYQYPVKNTFHFLYGTREKSLKSLLK